MAYEYQANFKTEDTIALANAFVAEIRKNSIFNCVSANLDKNESTIGLVINDKPRVWDTDIILYFNPDYCVILFHGFHEYLDAVTNIFQQIGIEMTWDEI
jgi:hypothetical protein